MASDKKLDMTSCLFALEPRIMYDAAGALEIIGNSADTNAQTQNIQNQDSEIQNIENRDTPDDAFTVSTLFDGFVPPLQASDTREIIIIDSRVENAQQLIQGASEDARVIVLDPSKDGLDQIDTILTSCHGLDALHIVSHGDEGHLNIGGTVLNMQSLENNASSIKSWGDALNSDGDILLYGCDVAKGDEGRLFVNQLSALTQADFAASTDSTGHEDLGGDWDLELHTGNIETEVAFSESAREEYMDTLEEPPILVSVDSTGTIADGSSWEKPAASMDGQWVAFGSTATNLVAGDTNGQTDIFVHDTQTGTTSRISVDSGGVQGNGWSYQPSISADGRYVAFESSASNLVAGDTNVQSDIFVHDTQTGTTSRVSVDSGGAEAVGGSNYDPSISADGRYVTFSSSATNLVAGDTNATGDIFVHDTQTGTTSRVSVDSGGAQTAGGSSYNPSISADGRYVVFESTATNLVAGDTNGQTDIFVHDTQTGITSRVSVDSVGVQGNGWSYQPSISADGRYVAFESSASNLVAGDTNVQSDIFVHDSQTGITSRVSVDSSGTEAAGGGSYNSSISADGRYVAFSSSASNLIPGDVNGLSDTFIHDRQTGTTELASTLLDGASVVSGVVLTGDGSSFVLSTNASLVPSDVNSMNDIYLLDFNDAPTLTAGSTTPYTENSPAVVIDNSISLTDDDTGMVGATITISSNYIAGEDVLSFTPVGSITGVWNSPSATLTLSGVDTIANYQAALRSVTFESTSNDPAEMGGLSRTISFELDDGDIVSPTATSTVNIVSVNDTPSLVSGAVTGYTENDPPTIIDSNIVLTDVDSVNMAGAQIRITANYIEGQDQLNFTPVGSITGVWDAPSATLTLSGVDTVANYEAALQSVTFESTANNPGVAGGLSRNIDFEVNDGFSVSPVAASTVNITAVNDPFLALPQPVNITLYRGAPEMETGGLLSDGMAGVVDPDGDLLGIAVIDVDNTNGFLQYSIDGGATWNNFGGVSDSNATLLSATPGTRLRFVPNDPEFIGIVNMNFRLWDQTIGSHGQTGVDTSVTGGMYPYSLNFRSVIYDIRSLPYTPPPSDTTIDPAPATETGSLVVEVSTEFAAAQSADNTGLISEFLKDATRQETLPPELDVSRLFPETADEALLEDASLDETGDTMEESVEEGEETAADELPDEITDEAAEEKNPEEDTTEEGEEQVLEDEAAAINRQEPVGQGLSGQLVKESLKTSTEAREILQLFEDVYDLLKCN